MNLLIVTDHQYLSYQGRVLDTYCFDRSFFDDYCEVFDRVTVLCRLKKVDSVPVEAKHSDGNGLAFRGVPAIHGIRWLLDPRIYRLEIFEAVKNADAVIARVPSQLGWHASRIAKKLQKPYMVEVIGDPYESFRGMGRGLHYTVFAMREAKRLRRLALNSSVASYVSRHHLQRKYPVKQGVLSENISSIRLDTGSLLGPRNYRLEKRALRVVLVASLISLKRHQDIIKAVRIAVDKNVEVEVAFVGEGPCRRELEALVDELGIASRIKFHGHISDRGTVFSVLDSSDIFIMASYTEGLPRAVIEAMSRGLPVIGTNIPGLQELLRPEDLFAVGDVEHLADHLIDVASNIDRMNDMSVHSCTTAALYTSEVLSPRRKSLFRQLREYSGDK